ncbi:hypothetical protein B0H10DRAFT_2043060 [Mycena sp. CBHHK59/15]|nr:hypothetical protein B0H10DRAFT_2043060 [Mycena sp. CBHHK59/15]
MHSLRRWYNVPPSKPPKKKLRTDTAPAEVEDEGGDSQPLNFDTFVPSHDPSLALPASLQPDYVPTHNWGELPPSPAGAMPGQDEAFARALGAMYWGGYWTAVYHASAAAFVSGLN